jgi:hypothetical protein
MESTQTPLHGVGMELKFKGSVELEWSWSGNGVKNFELFRD